MGCCDSVPKSDKRRIEDAPQTLPSHSPRKDSGIAKKTKNVSDKFSANFVRPEKGLEDLTINPSQFVIQQKESIYKNYDIQAKIGEGSFGVVYKARHKITNDIRAIKLIEKSSASEGTQAKLIHEISILKQLDHPNIVKLYEFYTDSKYYYLVTELVENGELFDEIQKCKSFSEEDAAYIIRQLLQAIIYCHEHKIVHRDLKPENILIDSKVDGKYNIKVIDFGTANAFSPNSKMRQMMGTPYYIAPEVLMKNYNEKCDVWSCGVILYILLCGLPPFNGHTDDAIMAAVRKTKFSYHHPIWQDISAEAKDLINNMIKYPPETRYSAFQAFSHSWISRKSFNQFKPETAKTLLENLKGFRSEQKLQQASLMYIVTQLVSKKEKEELQQTFMALDKNADGKLSREELIEGYTRIHGDEILARRETDAIMEHVDIDHNGYIDYAEFLLAAINKKKLISKENMRKAFSLFDRDGSGLISADELKTVLGIGKRFSEKVWEKLISEVDENSDGQISFEEFERMMEEFFH